MTASTLSPSKRISGPAATRAAAVIASTAASAARIWPCSGKFPSASFISSITAAIAPGPASIGIAIGKTETSSISGV